MSIDGWIVISPILFMLFVTVVYNYKIYKHNKENSKHD